MSLVWYGYKIILSQEERISGVGDKYIGCTQGTETWTSTEVIFVLSSALYKCHSVNEGFVVTNGMNPRPVFLESSKEEL
jgi:hypothetical protein